MPHQHRRLANPTYTQEEIPNYFEEALPLSFLEVREVEAMNNKEESVSERFIKIVSSIFCNKPEAYTPFQDARINLKQEKIIMAEAEYTGRSKEKVFYTDEVDFEENYSMLGTICKIFCFYG